MPSAQCIEASRSFASACLCAIFIAIYGMSLSLQRRIALVDQLMQKLHLPILIEIDEDGRYIVSCPLFKSCHSWGETIDEAMENISEVIEICLGETKIENLNTFVGFRELKVVRDAKASCDWQVGS